MTGKKHDDISGVIFNIVFMAGYIKKHMFKSILGIKVLTVRIERGGTFLCLIKFIGKI